MQTTSESNNTTKKNQPKPATDLQTRLDKGDAGHSPSENLSFYLADDQYWKFYAFIAALIILCCVQLPKYTSLAVLHQDRGQLAVVIDATESHHVTGDRVVHR